MIIDTHEHTFDAKTLQCWAASRIPDFEKNNVYYVEISINCFDIDDMAAIVTKNTPCLGIVPGQHPKLVSEDTDVKKIFSYVVNRLNIYNDHVLGLKTGLDYQWGENSKARSNQRELLTLFLEYAKDKHMPVVLHVRSHENEPEKADDDVIAALLCTGFDGKIVLHCFNGNKDIVRRYLEVNKNTYFGLGGVITYPGSQDTLEAIKNIPRTRILLETDGPYLKPFHPDGSRPVGKKNSSLNLPIVIEKIAETIGIEATEVEEITTRNACDFYNLRILEVVNDVCKEKKREHTGNGTVCDIYQEI